MTKHSYFGYSVENPYHISVGAVLVNDRGQVCVHHFIEHQGRQLDAYLLMRETIQPHETIEAALKRGLHEEFGATGTMRRYIGSLVSEFPMETTPQIVQKTTLYFIVDLDGMGPRPQNDEESHSILEWHDPAELIPIMKSQGKRLQREDADESVVMERLLTLTQADQRGR